jgi:hypothetical protein
VGNCMGARQFSRPLNMYLRNLPELLASPRQTPSLSGREGLQPAHRVSCYQVGSPSHQSLRQRTTVAGPSASGDRPTCRLRRRQPIGLRRCSASRGRWCAASERLRSPSARSRCSSPARRCCRRCHCDTMDMPRRSREHVARMQRSPRGRRQSRQTPSPRPPSHLVNPLLSA